MTKYEKIPGRIFMELDGLIPIIIKENEFVVKMLPMESHPARYQDSLLSYNSNLLYWCKRGNYSKRTQ